MIIRLREKNIIDVLDLVNRIEDKFEDFYFTFNKERIFLKNNPKLIKKILKRYECYGVYDKDLEGIALVYNEKGFRTYIKFLSFYDRVSNKIIQYILWNTDKDIFIKIKKNNTIAKYIMNSFTVIGDRGKEILLKNI